MKLKKLVLRVGVMIALASMLGGCIVVPYGHGGYGRYRDADRGYHDGRDGRDGRDWHGEDRRR